MFRSGKWKKVKNIMENYSLTMQQITSCTSKTCHQWIKI